MKAHHPPLPIPQARRYIRSLPFKPRIPPEKIYPNANPMALELLATMLLFHPEKRISVEEARTELRVVRVVASGRCGVGAVAHVGLHACECCTWVLVGAA